MTQEAERWLSRWTQHGLILPEAAAAIRNFEVTAAPPGKTRWAAALAWGFGALLIGAGILLFVRSNWDQMAPAFRLALIFLLTAGFHVAAGFCEKTPALRIALHGVGTAALGAGIALTGQVFHLSSGWNGWMLLWAIGAAAGYWLIRDWLQLVIAAMLIPLWITSEWMERGPRSHGELTLLFFWIAVPLLYFVSRLRPLVWLGGLGLIGNTIGLLILGYDNHAYQGNRPASAYWAYVILLFVFAAASRATFGGFQPKGFAALGIAAVLSFAAIHIGGWLIYLLLGISYCLLAAWGVSEQKVLFVNAGTIGFAITVLGFYFSHALSMLNGSLSLILLGVILLGGGFLLERVRRKLVGEASGGVA